MAVVSRQTGEDPGWGLVGAQRGQVLGDHMRVTEAAEQAVDAVRTDGNEEVLKIETQNDVFARVARSPIQAVAGSDETEGVGMRRDMIEQARKDLSLKGLEAWFWCFDQTQMTTAF